jgi:ketosteroid isomerase-like protein
MWEMPRDRERIAERLFEAFNRRDLEEALALVHSEIVFEPVTAAAMSAGEPYCGHEGIRRYLADIEAHWRELIVRPVQIRAAGQAVVALGEVSGRGAMGGFDGASTTWVLKFREGLVVHAQIFSDARVVRGALGVEED